MDIMKDVVALVILAFWYFTKEKFVNCYMEKVKFSVICRKEADYTDLTDWTILEKGTCWATM